MPDAGAADSGPVGVGPIGKGGATEYAPYFYTWGFGNPAYAFTSLVDLKAKSGLNAATLAFVIAAGNGCAISTDGASNFIETNMKDDIDAFRAQGGHLKVSFGGAVGTYVENACASAGDLTALLEGFVSRTGLTDLDFDVEQWEAMTTQINDKRATALRALQAAHPDVRVSLTLPVLPTGLLSAGATDAINLIRQTRDAGVRISHVNLMTMDYGNFPGAMGDLAVQALSNTHDQLKGLYPSASDAQLWGMLGATPMIGQNDVAGEVFTLADAQVLTTFARAHGVGLISFWAINRDQPCAGLGNAVCNGQSGRNFAFHDVFRILQ